MTDSLGLFARSHALLRVPPWLGPAVQEEMERSRPPALLLFAWATGGRAGFVAEAGRQNMPLPETMAMTGHQSVAIVMGYFRAESVLGSKVSRMLDND
jgi:hypothetical protein